MIKDLVKGLRALAVLAICAVLLGAGYVFLYKKPLGKEIDTTKTTIITQLVALNNIETAKMTLHKVVEGKQGLQDLVPNQNRDNLLQNFLFQDKIIIDAYADIIAGFELNTLTSGSIVVNPDKSVTVILPAPKILSAMLTNDTKPFLRKTGVLTQGDIQLETEVRNKTLLTMSQEAIQKGLLEAAKKNASPALEAIINHMGYKLNDIIIQEKQPQKHTQVLPSVLATGQMLTQ